ncbi:MAG: hypothetical protein J0L93_09635 [Deltaproteobacteria bacterium]|nr:hypothetical protein [Deltaproteobacteria bacterium]
MKFISKLKIFVFLCLINLTLSEATSAATQAELRFTCQEANAIGEKAERILIRLTEILNHQRELAIQAANSTLGTADRQFLQITYAKKNEEIFELITRASFTDTFGDTYAFFKDGLQFRTLRHSAIDQVNVPINYRIEPFDLSIMGSLAEIFLTIEPKDNSYSFGNFLLNDILIEAPTANEDTISVDGNLVSSIAIAKRINAQASFTQVYSEVRPTEVEFKNLNFTGNSNQSLKAGEFKINGVSITGNVSTLPNFISAINFISSSTAVKASLAIGSTENILLTAADGRNISFFLTPEASKIFGGKINAGKQTFFGKFKLRSSSPFKLKINSSLFDLSEERIIERNQQNILKTEISTQTKASWALAQLDAAIMQTHLHRSQITPILGNCPPR